MNMRSLAESDLSFTLEDSEFGFGWDVILTDPANFNSTDLKCQSSDITAMFDVDTGELITDRTAAAVFRISTLVAQGFTSLPKEIPDQSMKPWIVKFNDINGNPYTFKVINGMPDRTLGVVKCKLTAYRETPPS